MIGELLRESLRSHPDKTLRDESHVLTYREFLHQVEKLGESLTGQKYGILCASELAAARGLAACLMAGVTAVPLSYRYGEQHTRKILDTVGITRLITDQGIQQLAPDRPETEELRDVALIMCTSGTTGAPKGAMITREGLTANVLAVRDYFRIAGSDRILIARPLYHCAVLTGEFLVSLLKGLDIVFYNGAFNPLKAAELVRREGITVLGGTPTLFYHFSRLAARTGGEPLRLRVLAVSGECMTPVTAQRIRGAFPGAEVYHVYGLTEASPRVSYLPPEEFDEAPESVGRLLPCLEGKIEDGELCLRGKTVMKGYYARPDLTDQALAGGWLHTGDLARTDEKGRLVLLGRKDHLIIRGGMNIYPQEIENALKQDSRVEEVLAYGIRDKEVGQRIGLKAVAPGLTRQQVLEICRRRCLSFQVPDVVEVVDRLPRNGSGKLLRPKE